MENTHRAYIPNCMYGPVRSTDMNTCIDYTMDVFTEDSIGTNISWVSL